MALVVYGASDDAIVIVGAINEEFPYMRHGGQPPADLLAFSDGTLLRITFTDEGRDGVWRIQPLVNGTAEVRIDQAPVSGGGYSSDRATFTGDGPAWVVHGRGYATSR